MRLSLPVSRGICGRTIASGRIGWTPPPRLARPCAPANSYSGWDPASSFDPPEQVVDRQTLEKISAKISEVSDSNLLQTALATAIAAEDYALAAKVRDQIAKVAGGESAERIDWHSLKLPEWLVDRVERLGFKFPTEVQRRASPVILSGADTIIQSATGSGKTLAFLAATLARLNYPPDLMPEDLEGPQAIIVVPTMELGVQCSLMVYKMFGGNTGPGKPGDPSNMFSYFGPKGIKVRGLLSKEEVVKAKTTDYLAAVHVVVATPAALMEVYSGDNAKPILGDLKVLAIDEYDECFNQSPEGMALLMASACSDNVSEEKPQMVLVGATIEQHQLEDALAARWIKDPVQILVGKELAVPSSLRHKFLVCDSSRRLMTLVKMLREDLKQASKGGMPARAIVFANSVEEAAAIAEPLYSSLWNEHVMAIMLPSGTPLPWSDTSALAMPPEDADEPDEPGSTSRDGILRNSSSALGATQQGLAGSAPFSAQEPIIALHAFRDNQATLLLCTPEAARGLDLPAVSHVYNLGCPPSTAQYLHRAGRTGRIGSTEGGTVTTIVNPEDAPQMLEIAEKLDLDIVKQEASAGGSKAVEAPSDESDVGSQKEKLPDEEVDKLRKDLDDIFNLM